MPETNKPTTVAELPPVNDCTVRSLVEHVVANAWLTMPDGERQQWAARYFELNETLRILNPKFDDAVYASHAKGQNLDVRPIRIRKTEKGEEPTDLDSLLAAAKRNS